MDTMTSRSTFDNLAIGRQGVTTGRWPKYTLFVDGKLLGSVRRTKGGWVAGEIDFDTQELAEASLIEEAQRAQASAPIVDTETAEASVTTVKEKLSQTKAAKAAAKRAVTERIVARILSAIDEGGPAVRAALDAEFWISKRGGVKNAAEKKAAFTRSIELIDDAVVVAYDEFDTPADRALVVMEAIEREFWIMRRGGATH